MKIKMHPELYWDTLPIAFHPGIKSNNLINISAFNDTGNFKDSFAALTRKPEGINYKKKPIVIFGCSFAYGANLENEQTFSYKLAQLTQRPVYNRAFTAWGIQHALNQARQPDFYKYVPEPEYVIYVMMYDHFRRLYVPTFLTPHMLLEYYNLRYEDKDGELILKSDKNKLSETFNRLYSVQKLKHFYINNILMRKENHKQYFDFAIKHFVELRKQTQKHWKNTKYVIILYHSFWFDEEFIEELKNNGFIVISPPYDYGLYLHLPEYLLPDKHPNEKAWNALTPKVKETLKL